MAREAGKGKFRGIPLRAHHLLCLLGFQGIGYTAGFIRNFQKVKRLIEQHPDLVVEVVDSCDVICIACPNMQDGECFKNGLKYNEKVKCIDGRVMAKLGIKPGDRFKAKDLYALVKEKIEPADIKDICQGCDWLNLGFCPRGLANL
ncbi:MAG TPA: DUF1284 domain-containing protein [Methanocella sp.]|nr:DUF1284 domain-containing protein [Methanocella sp.]